MAAGPGCISHSVVLDNCITKDKLFADHRLCAFTFWNRLYDMLLGNSDIIPKISESPFEYFSKQILT